MNDPSQYPAVQPKPYPWGCLIGGCLTVVLLGLLGIGAISYTAYSFVTAQLNKYTSTQPMVLPATEYTTEEVAAVQKRFDDFIAAIDQGETPEELVLTSDDINALISQNEQLKGKVHVTIENGELVGNASIPVDFIPGAKGRFFNGRLSLKASLENGVLIVTLDEAEVNGEPVPEQFLEGMRSENLAKDAYKDSKSAEVLRKFERLIIEEDRIILKPAAVKEKKVDSNPAESTEKRPDDLEPVASELEPVSN